MTHNFLHALYIMITDEALMMHGAIPRLLWINAEAMTEPRK